MSCHGFRHVLVLLDDDETATRGVMERAIGLAEVERARLTIARTTDPGRMVRWLGPLTVLSRCGPMIAPDIEAARRALDRVTASVPAAIPLTRVLLGQDTPRALRELTKTDHYDLLIVKDSLIAHHRALRRDVRRLGLCVLAVCPHLEAAGMTTTTLEDVLEHQH